MTDPQVAGGAGMTEPVDTGAEAPDHKCRPAPPWFGQIVCAVCSRPMYSRPAPGPWDRQVARALDDLDDLIKHAWGTGDPLLDLIADTLQEAQRLIYESEAWRRRKVPVKDKAP